MRVICMVPSWTETLMEAGIQVVGRTRFCIHPSPRVKDIPAVGGTKDIQWEKVKALNADLLLLDREENPISFAEDSPIAWHATHVKDLESMAKEIASLADLFGSAALNSLAIRAQKVIVSPSPEKRPSGVLERWGEWDLDQEIVYLIWKNPWMAAGKETYIASVLQKLGFKMAPLPPGRYPEISEELLREKVGLFSSEPYPFLKKKFDLPVICRKGAIVDGESFSWFGVRGIQFLEKNCLEP